jgi:hypothetical protein
MIEIAARIFAREMDFLSTDFFSEPHASKDVKPSIDHICGLVSSSPAPVHPVGSVRVSGLFST